MLMAKKTTTTTQNSEMAKDTCVHRPTFMKYFQSSVIQQDHRRYKICYKSGALKPVVKVNLKMQIHRAHLTVRKDSFTS